MSDNACGNCGSYLFEESDVGKQPVCFYCYQQTREALLSKVEAIITEETVGADFCMDSSCDGFRVLEAIEGRISMLKESADSNASSSTKLRDEKEPKPRFTPMDSVQIRQVRERKAADKKGGQE